MNARGELRLQRSAKGDSARALRHALASFMSAADIDADCIDDVITAVGEALANAIEHAYPNGSGGQIEIAAAFEGRDRVVVEVTDHGAFIERAERAGRGFGLRIVRQIARDVQIDTKRGTTIRMTFDTRSAQPSG